MGGSFYASVNYVVVRFPRRFAARGETQRRKIEVATTMANRLERGVWGCSPPL